MKVSEYMQLGRKRLSESQIQCADPGLHIRQIMQVVLGVDSNSSKLFYRMETELQDHEYHQAEAFLIRRMVGEPFQYIVGYEWFWEAQFKVGPGVLIPRPETELVLERLFEYEEQDCVRIAELGAGSGNIGISALRERPHWIWHAFECNGPSLSYLSANREGLLAAEARYQIVAEDFFESAKRYQPYEWLVSNPPYVCSSQLGALPLEVRHEPTKALDGGARGIEVITKLVEITREWLTSDGQILLEIGEEQGEEVSHLLSRSGFSGIELFRDYSNRDRVVYARRS